MLRLASVLVAATVPGAGCSQPGSPSTAASGVASGLVPSPAISPLATVQASPSAIRGTIVFSRIEDTAADGRLRSLVRGGRLQAFDLAGLTCCLALSPDGAWILVPANEPGGRITSALVHPDDTGYRVLPFPDRSLNVGLGAWSAAGDRIALEGWDDTNSSRNGIYSARPDGSEVRQLTATRAACMTCLLPGHRTPRASCSSVPGRQTLGVTCMWSTPTAQACYG